VAQSQEGSSSSFPQQADPQIADAIRRGAETAAAEAKAGVIAISAYVQENHYSVRIFAFLTALLLCVLSVIGAVNITGASSPIHYLYTFYNMLFACIIVVMDGKPEWFERLWNLQDRLFSACACLASQPGRALLYFYVGSTNLVLVDGWMYVICGIFLCTAGVLTLVHYFSSRRSAAGEGALPPQQEQQQRHVAREGEA